MLKHIPNFPLNLKNILILAESAWLWRCDSYVQVQMKDECYNAWYRRVPEKAKIRKTGNGGRRRVPEKA